MTSKLQKPSESWKTGVDHVKSLSHAPTVAVSARPSGPNIHWLTEVSSALFPLNVRSTQPRVSVTSTEKRFSDHINKDGKMIHCVAATSLAKAQRNREVSGVANRRTE